MAEKTPEEKPAFVNPMDSYEGKLYTTEEISKHNKSAEDGDENDVWMIIGTMKTGGMKVYDVSKYLDEHPGGAEVLMDIAGKDATTMFEDIGHSQTARKQMESLEIGAVKLTEEELEAAMKEDEKAASSGGSFPILPIMVIIIAAVIYYVTNMKK